MNAKLDKLLTILGGNTEKKSEPKIEKVAPAVKETVKEEKAVEPKKEAKVEKPKAEKPAKKKAVAKKKK